MATLNDLMEFDHPVYVNADGTVTDPPCPLYAPELFGVDDSELQAHSRPTRLVRGDCRIGR